MHSRFLFSLILLFAGGMGAQAQNFVTTKSEAGAFAVASTQRTASIYVDSADYFVVRKAADMLQEDIQKVTDKRPSLYYRRSALQSNAIIIGSVQKSALIQQLVKTGKIDIRKLKGKWEAYNLQVVSHPVKGIDKALVIVGSDPRGAAYGVFTLSRQMGVSPWHWWADVPVHKKKEVFIKSGSYHYGPPAVKYRGIFLNDEAPALSGWVHEKFGGFNHTFYIKLFKLMLRLRANYLWPAMWGNAFAADDTLNPVLANKYGIVMGTAHNEPMMRAHQEWKDTGHGPWNYQTNSDTLQAFWRKGIRRLDDRESIVTIGMRGNGDKAMTSGTNIKLLEKIVQDQRNIIANVTEKPPSKTPQIWALYKEVQDYYDQGMRVPDDVTLLYSDDNWGDIRRLPQLKDSTRIGGYGIYYHFDYVGGPRNYKWLNTSPIPKIWEQMNMAYQYHARKIWIVNVGDLKPMEFPISFFMDYAWNPDQWPAERLLGYTRQWVQQQFGMQYADEITSIIIQYTKFNGRRKPELISPDTYSLTNYREAEGVVKNYNQLMSKAKKIYAVLPSNMRAAYYQLVLYPVEACANLNNMYVTAALNHLYAKQGRALTNILADSVKQLFARDSLLSHYYNKVMANGKWDHMMDQTHIGYTYWQEPDHNNMPKVQRIALSDSAEMGIAVEGSRAWWPASDSTAELPAFDRFQPKKRYIELFNRGEKPFNYKVKTAVPWLKISSTKGQVFKQKRLWVQVDWAEASSGTHKVPIIIQGKRRKVRILAKIVNPEQPERRDIHGFAEALGYVSMEAADYTKAVHSQNIHWKEIPDLGRTLSGMMPEPVTANSQTPGGNSPHLEYEMYLFHSGTVQVNAYMLPTLDIHDKGGSQFALSIDHQPPKIVTMDVNATHQSWQNAVKQNIKIMTVKLHIDHPGTHTLKFWMINPGMVLEKLVVDTGGLQPSYLGPPESFNGAANKL